MRITGNIWEYTLMHSLMHPDHVLMTSILGRVHVVNPHTVIGREWRLFTGLLSITVQIMCRPCCRREPTPRLWTKTLKQLFTGPCRYKSQTNTSFYHGVLTCNVFYSNTCFSMMTLLISVQLKSYKYVLPVQCR